MEMASDTKSTVGDKHETSRAMAQLEMEKLGHQIMDYQKQSQAILQLKNKISSPEKIGPGSLIQLSNGWYFLGVGIGNILFEEKSIFCVSIQSPIGKQLFGKKVGDEIQLPKLQLKIISFK